LTRIKICGNTEAAGCELAVTLGVDLLGFIFAPSPRQVSVEQARDIVRGLPEAVEKVGVFVDEPVDEINRIVEACGLTAVQLHPRRPVEVLSAIPVPAIQVYRVGAQFRADAVDEATGQRVLLDTAGNGKEGGTGRTFDWTLAEPVVQRHPTLVSGGLRPENVGAAVRMLRPYGVDVASGVESGPGIKDLGKLAWFVKVVRAADREATGNA
jgi:phosphoribosylanthranilate isomerase